ncbi:hypothetical protein DFR49_3755 [Hephaestia caeni]|uniref:Uncharacterized protein n=1 Tax=Hephaestia caeni TaxID=645617 RepID=A0A397NK74_9SPHN|nr:hypothetical protein [Hephaestia caeni]RIA37866.1 hypothetical protein DFR49_3755 [Hephaestia caeni]
MIAIGFGPSLARSGAPRAGFDFTTGALPAGASLARASIGSRFDASGVLRIESSNVARFDHDPASSILRGLLIEPEQTNEVLMSEDIGDASWTKLQSPEISRNVADAPTGVPTGDTLRDTNIGQYSGVSQTFATIAARTVSLFVRKDTSGRAIRFTVLRGGPPLSDLALDTATGDVKLSGPGSVSGAAHDCGAFWRLVLVNNTAYDSLVIFPAAGASASWTYSAGATGSAVIWGVQAERGAHASSYIPTDTMTATRAADVLTLDWGRFAVPDGPLPLRYLFDDGSSQDGMATVTGGLATVPTTLARPWLRRVERR